MIFSSSFFLNYFSLNLNLCFANILPTLSLLDAKDEKTLFDNLKALDFPKQTNVAA